MENTKIFIDIDDEITFVVDRIAGAKTQQIILVVPERAGILSSLASLKLLYHLIQRAEKKVVLVTMDEIGKTLAQKGGFKTRARVGEVEADVWDQILIETKTSELLQTDFIPVVKDEEPVVKAVEEDVLESNEVNSLLSAQETLFDSPTKVESTVQSDAGLSVGELKEMNPPVKEIDRIVKKTTTRTPRIIQLEGFELMVGGDIAEKRNKNSN